MQMKSFKLFSLATIMSLNSIKAAVCGPAQVGTPIIGYSQPSNVENCGQVPQAPLVYDNSTNNQNGGGITPECIVASYTPGPGSYIPGQTQTPVVPVQPQPQPGQMVCIPVNPPSPSNYPPQMATTPINPASEPTPTPSGSGSNTPPGTPGTPGTPGAPGTPGTPGTPQTPVPTPTPRPETQCTVTTKLDCDPAPGSENNVPPTTPGGHTPGVPVQPVVPFYSVLPPPVQPQKVYSVVPAPPVPQIQSPPKPFVPSNQPMVCQVPQNGNGGHQTPSGSNGTPSYPVVPVAPQPTCIAPPIQPQHTVPSYQTPSTTISSAAGTGVSTTGTMSMCNTPQNALNALCATPNAATTRAFTASNTGAACNLPNAEKCLTKAIENIGKVPLTDAASCVLPAKQPMVDIGILVPASESYTQAWNSPCVMPA